MLWLKNPSWVPLVLVQPGDVLVVESSRMYYRPETVHTSEARFISVRARTKDTIFATPPCTRGEYCATVPAHAVFAFSTRGTAYLIKDGGESRMHLIGSWVQVVALAPECIWRGSPTVARCTRDDN